MLEFTLVAKSDNNDLIVEVNELLSEGWTLRGDTFIKEGGYGTFCQALTKEKEEKNYVDS